MMAKCEECNGHRWLDEHMPPMLRRMPCPKCNPPAANEPPSEADVPHDQDGDVGW